MLLADASRRALADGRRSGILAPASTRVYRMHLRTALRAIGDRDLRQIRRRDLEAWIHEPDISLPLRQGRLSAIRWVIGWAIDHEHMASDPTRSIRLPKPPRRPPRRLGTSDTRRVSDSTDPRMRLILALMLHEGLRCGEVARLTYEDLDLVDATMLVRGKGGHHRALPITLATVAELRTWMVASGSRAGPVIRSLTCPERDIQPGTISALVSRHMADVGIHVAGDGKTAHALRHTAASTVLERCGDLRTVARMLGHQSVVTTERYTSGVDVDLRAAMG